MNTCYNPFSLSGKTIFVTGASSGIGKAIACACASGGARVIITGRNSTRLQETYMSLSGEAHLFIEGDLTNDETINKILKFLPKLDGMVLAAGFVEMWPVLFASKEKFHKIYDTNLFSPVELLRNIVKKKLYNPGLSVVGIASVAGTYDFGVSNGIYGSGKAALQSFLKYFALETASKGIRVNTISPGMILTPMHTEGVVEDEQLSRIIENIPIKRWGMPEDIANGAVYLLSDASSYVTGVDIKIDGGLTL